MDLLDMCTSLADGLGLTQRDAVDKAVPHDSAYTSDKNDMSEGICSIVHNLYAASPVCYQELNHHLGDSHHVQDMLPMGTKDHRCMLACFHPVHVPQNNAQVANLEQHLYQSLTGFGEGLDSFDAHR